MNGEHTTGKCDPTAERCAHSPWKYSRAVAAGVFLINDANGHAIGEVRGHEDIPRLIVTAPDLLALAHQYVRECGDCSGTRVVPNGRGGDEPCTECRDIWAIIDKAEGRS